MYRTAMVEVATLPEVEQVVAEVLKDAIQYVDRAIGPTMAWRYAVDAHGTVYRCEVLVNAVVETDDAVAEAVRTQIGLAGVGA